MADARPKYWTTISSDGDTHTLARATRKGLIVLVRAKEGVTLLFLPGHTVADLTK